MKVVYATATTMARSPAGFNVTVRQGSHWPADDPIVVAYPSLFSEDPRYGLNASTPRDEVADAPVEQATAALGDEVADVPVEQATAAPGEKRAARRG